MSVRVYVHMWGFLYVYSLEGVGRVCAWACNVVQTLCLSKRGCFWVAKFGKFCVVARTPICV